jgi:hypothetical protein
MSFGKLTSESPGSDTHFAGGQSGKIYPNGCDVASVGIELS